MDIRELQQPLKQRYRADPAASLVTLTARGSQAGGPVGCEVDAPDASPEQLTSLLEKTERYCTVLQTLRRPPVIDGELAVA